MFEHGLKHESSSVLPPAGTLQTHRLTVCLGSYIRSYLDLQSVFGVLRGSFGGVGVFPLAASLSEAFGGDVVFHLTVVAHLIGFGHVLETLLITGRQSLEAESRQSVCDL